MSVCNRVEVHYLTKAGTAGVYDIPDLAISGEDENKVVCSWLLSQNATKDTGTLCFLLRFSCVAEDGTVEYAWNSGIYNGITITEGMNNTAEILEQYADIIGQWFAILEARQYKTAIIIGHSASGATSKSCDVLYNDGDNFATAFSVAYEQATSSGINRIEILEGAYELAESIRLGHGINIIGIGANAPQLSMKIRDSAPIRPHARMFFVGGNEGEVYRFENIYFDDGGDLAAFHIDNGALTLKNVRSDYIALNHNNIVSQYPENIYIENCTFGELILDKTTNSHILNSSIYILSLGSETSGNIVTGNSISEFADDGENNVIQNNIINGVPQVGSVDLSGHQFKTEITIGNASVHGTSENCDVLYSISEDFTEVFNTAKEMAVKKGFNTIRISKGTYISYTPIVIDEVLDVKGDAMPVIYFRPENNPDDLFMQDFITLDVYRGDIEGVSLQVSNRGKSAIVVTLGNHIINNIKTNGAVNIYEGCVNLQNSEVCNINSDTSIQDCIISGNKVSENIDVPAEKNVIANNIINGVPQTGGGGDIGNIETALDEIITLQNTLMGGDSV